MNEIKKPAKRFNTNKPRYSLIRLNCFDSLARVLQYGRDKYSEFRSKIDGKTVRGSDIPKQEILDTNLWIRTYDARSNWDNGLVLSEVLDSLMRHVGQMQEGEWLDVESGLPHIGHIQANAMFLGSKNIINDLTK